MILRQIARFSVSGVANTLVGVSAIYILMALGAHYVAANFFGYALGFALSYVLNKRWVFAARSRSGSDIVPFACVVGAAYLVNAGILIVLVEGVGASPYLGQALGIGAYAALTFLGLKYLVFAKRDSL